MNLAAIGALGLAAAVRLASGAGRCRTVRIACITGVSDPKNACVPVSISNNSRPSA
jgi:hypothetical protein